MKKMTVFGKKGCDLCKKRLEFAESYKNRTDADYEIEYLDVDEPNGLVEFAKIGSASDIPTVVYSEDGENKQVWSGPTEFPNTRSMRALFGTEPIEAGGSVVMIPEGEIKRYDSSSRIRGERANCIIVDDLSFEDTINENKLED